MEKKVSFIFEPATYGLWPSDGSFSLLYIFVLDKLFLLRFYLAFIGIPLPLFRSSGTESLHWCLYVL